MRSLAQCLKKIAHLQKKRAEITAEVQALLQESKHELRQAQKEKREIFAARKLKKRQARWKKVLELKERGLSLQRIGEYFDVTKQMAKYILDQAEAAKEKGEI